MAKDDRKGVMDILRDNRSGKLKLPVKIVAAVVVLGILAAVASQIWGTGGVPGG